MASAQGLVQQVKGMLGVQDMSIRQLLTQGVNLGEQWDKFLMIVLWVEDVSSLLAAQRTMLPKECAHLETAVRDRRPHSHNCAYDLEGAGAADRQ